MVRTARWKYVHWTSGYRPQLTVPGRVLLDDVRVILARTDSLHARALSFSTGLEPELTLSVEALFPVAVLAAALRDFRARFPTVNVRVFSETLGTWNAQNFQGCIPPAYSLVYLRFASVVTSAVARLATRRLVRPSRDGTSTRLAIN